MHLPRTTRSSTRRERTRGQSLVEFAITLPIILFLTLIALDFGRVYLGWINLESMSRIAANLAANNPTAWADNDTSVKAKYQNQIINDAAATNCLLPMISGVPTAPDPVFADTTGNGSTEDLGDTATVRLSCTFNLITPGIRNILGGSIAVSASSVFPVKTGMTDPGAGGGVVGVAPNAAFTGDTTIAPSTISCVAPCTVVFRDTSGGNPTSWLWVFNDGSPNSIAQDPGAHTFLLAGTYIVSMTATNNYGSSTQTMGVTVTTPSTVDFTSDKTSGTNPLTVTFTDASSPGGSNYSWTFGTGEGSGSGTTVNHTYNSPGSYTVALSVTYAGPGTITTTKTNYITVAVGLCTVPHLDGVKRNSAQATWTGAGFSGTVSDGPGAPNGNYTIKSQSLTATSQVPCSSSVTVNNP
jgi:PKD repeat protein